MSDALVYLASPYSDPDPAVRQARYEAAVLAIADCFRSGILAFSPIVHSHPIAMVHDLPKGWEFWRRLDLALLRKCDRMVVLCIPGWKESSGVQAEIEFALGQGMSVEYIEPR